MDPAGLAVLVGVLVLATRVGLVSRARACRVRPARAGGTAHGGWALAGRTPTVDERVLLLQLSSPVCAPCRQTAAVLEGLTARTSGLVHAEIDVADQPDTARELGVMRTPTVVAFDRSGSELLRVFGVPRAAELASALAPSAGPVSPTGRQRSHKPESSVTLGAVNWPLTRRRAVDLCRVGSCLCRAS